jgi:hypothetical protein
MTAGSLVVGANPGRRLIQTMTPCRVDTSATTTPSRMTVVDMTRSDEPAMNYARLIPPVHQEGVPYTGRYSVEYDGSGTIDRGRDRGDAGLRRGA